MFSANTFIALLAFVPYFLVRAEVLPVTPAPGAVYNEGSPCPIAWTGDTNSTTLWKNMAILLMTGDNFNMVFITTVATGQDGTVSGTFSYTCPQVTPNSAIYFYQFVAPLAMNETWIGTGRFAIASSTGVTTPPTNLTQPDGSPIPWGTGALVNPSDAVAQPSFANISTSMTLSSSIAANSSTASVLSSTTRNAGAPIITTAGTTATPVVSLSTSASPTGQSTSGAMATFDIRVWGVAAAAATLALSFVW